MLDKIARFARHIAKLAAQFQLADALFAFGRQRLRRGRRLGRCAFGNFCRLGRSPLGKLSGFRSRIARYFGGFAGRDLGSLRRFGSGILGKLCGFCGGCLRLFVKAQRRNPRRHISPRA